MSAFLLRFKANYREKMHGYTSFSFVDYNSPFKDLLFPRGPNLAQKPWYFIGTVLNYFKIDQTYLTQLHRKFAHDVSNIGNVQSSCSFETRTSSKFLAVNLIDY